jgi:hypothetical protein
MLLADYHIQAAEGYQVLGQPQLACGHLERALSIANENHMNQVVFYVEEALQRVTTPVAPAQSTSEPESAEDVREIAGAIRRMRETAGTAH